MRRFALFGLVLFANATYTSADEKLKGIACRSVHLTYKTPVASALYAEVEVEESARGTYFMVCGWSKGYFGIQELANGKKLLLFSVWDPTSGDDPKTVLDSNRVKMLYKDPEVRVQRFGNEGTGGQSFYDYDWKAGETYRFMVKAKAEGSLRTEYAAWFFHPERKEWMQLVSFSTLTKDRLKGCYSFIEDFRRNKISSTKTRIAEFGGGWMHGLDGQWHELAKARFTGDRNPVLNIDSGIAGGRFFLKTGGEIANEGTKLNATMERPATKGPPEAP
jgi:Domain of unknown function (DUF3472)/Domain of unknown function (DUF5077)